jgi:hypothetical protein
MLGVPCLFAHASDVRRPPAPPCRLSGAAGVQRRRAAGSSVAPALGPRVAQRSRRRSGQPGFQTSPPVAVHAALRGGRSAARRTRAACARCRAERRTPVVMFGWRMPAGVPRDHGDFVGASHSRRLRGDCASPRKRFVPLAVRAAALACERRA